MGVLVALLLVALASSVHAQVFYSYPGARPVIDTSVSLGLVSGFGEDTIRLGGFSRFNLTSVADLGFEAHYENLDVEGVGDDDTGFFEFGIDGKYLLMSADQDMPLDIAAQGGVGIMISDELFKLHVPIGVIASHDFVTSNGRKIVPYGGGYLLFDYVKFKDAAPGEDDSETDFDVEMRIGASAEIVTGKSLFAALHAGNGTMFFLGFNAGL
jgi:hypothetical protein